MMRVSGEPMITQVAMSARPSVGLAERHDRDALVGPARRRGRRSPERWCRQHLPQYLEGLAELPGTRLADRIVERDDEPRFGGKPQAAG